MKKFLALLVAVLMIMALVPMVALALPGVSLTGGTNTTADYNASSVFIAPSIVVNSSSNLEGASIVVRDLPEDCTIGHTDTPAGITITVREDNKVIRLSGSASAADYQQALRGIYVNTGTTAATATFDIAIGGSGNLLYNSANQHFYEYVGGYLVWHDAKNAVDSSNHFGLSGYLATVTSIKENDFVSKLCGGQGWFGASDADTEGTWKWITGPEEDTVFWKDGYTRPGKYSNWRFNQPNDDGNEDYLCVIENGEWTDLNHSSGFANGYVVEYGGMAGDPVVDVSETCRLSITAPYSKSNVLIAPTIELNFGGSTPLSAAVIAVTSLPEDCTIGHMDMPAGITVTVREDNKVIRLSGTASVPSYQQALRSIYINTSTTAGTVTFDISPGNAVYNRANQHFYEYVAGTLTWQDANNGAQSRSYFGLQGYLGTITSKNENDFVATYCGGQGWIGGSDEDTENTWKWVTGPEAGTIFWRDGYMISGQYSNFQAGEPNDYGFYGEDYMFIYGYDLSTPADKFGQWCDFHHTNSSIKGYVVEYGGTVGDPEVDVTQTYQLTIAPSKHTVSFNSHGGSAVDSISDVTYGSTISEPSEPTCAGYDFAEWYKTTAYNTQWNFSTDTVSSDFELHARWTPRNDTPFIIEHYKQDADGEGYTLADTDNLTGTTDALAWATAFAKTYTGFTENTTHPQRVVAGTIAADGSLVLKLFYDRKKYTVLFNSHGGSSVDPMSNVLYGGAISEPSEPNFAGYSFDGWFKTDAYNTQWNFISDTVSGDMTLHAKWGACSGTPYTVEHYKQDVQGEGYTLADTDNMSGKTNETATAVAKTYTGFNENTTHAQRVAGGTVAADGSLVLKLYYDREEYTVTFDKNTTDSVTGLPSGQSIRNGGKVTEPNNPARQDFAFIGWFKESECTNQWSFAVDTVQAETTLYAKWSQDEFMVSYDNNGGSGSASEKQYDGATFTLHDGKGFSKDKYVIDGWSIDGKNYELGALYTMPSGNVAAKAIWAADGDNDGISDKDETAAGTDPGDEKNMPDLGMIRITVLGADGEGEAGLTCVLNSQPLKVTTDDNGVAVFKDVALAPHTLSVRSSSTQLGTYSINFAKGSENGTKISDSGSTDSIGGVTATVVTGTFLSLDLTIKQSGGGQWAIDDSSHTEQVQNPKTGTWSFAWLWVCAAVVLAAGGVFFIRRRLMQK